MFLLWWVARQAHGTEAVLAALQATAFLTIGLCHDPDANGFDVTRSSIVCAPDAWR